MSTTKQLVILAKSRMGGGLCFAGRELDGERAWVRINGPDVNRPAIQKRLCKYQDGDQAQLLDIVEIAFDRHEPDEHQTENWLIDPEVRWRRIDALPLNGLPPFVDDADGLWYDEDWPGGSTVEGCMDRVPRKFAEDATDSLRLLKVDGLHIKLYPRQSRHEYQWRPQLYTRFNHGDLEYTMHCTDIRMEEQYCHHKDEREWDLGPSFICVSLASFYKGHAHKLVAGVIPQA